MGTQTKILGRVSVHRGPFNLEEVYYKKNTVLFANGTYEVTVDEITGVEPLDENGNLNPGWETHNAIPVVQEPGMGENEKKQVMSQDAVTKTYGHVEENPEYVEATIDADGKLIEGITVEGQKYLAKPSNQDEKLQKQIDETKQANLDQEERLTSVEEKTIEITREENPEYVEATLDAEGKLLEGMTVEGQKYLAKPSNQDEKLQEQIDNLKQEVTGNIVEQALEQIEETKQQVIDELDRKLESVPFSVIDNPEYVEATLDQEDKIIEGLTVDGVKEINTKTRFKQDVELKGKTKIDGSLEMSEEGKDSIINIIRNSGYSFDQVVDWSNEKELRLPMPTVCTRINLIINHNYNEEQIAQYKNDNNWPNILMPTAKNIDKPAIMQFWDKNGNYFSKKVLLNAQGGSSMRYWLKNLSFDLDDDSEIKFGNWVSQDSYHLKFYYQDVFKVYCIAGYRIGEKIIQHLNCRSNRHKKGNLVTDFYGNGIENNIQNTVNTGALCHPDGFPVEIYVNGEYQGLYMWQLKKHRANYDMKKGNYDEVLIDSVYFGESTNCFYKNHVPWSTIELKNPKEMITMDGKLYDNDSPKELIDETSDYWYTKVPEYFPTGVKNAKKYKEICQNTLITKNLINELSNYLDEINNSENKTEEFEKHFDKKMCIAYFLLINLLYGYDNTNHNWIWTCYQKMWGPNFYDLDTTCGKSASGNIVQSQSVNTFITMNSTKHPIGFVYANYRKEIESIYAELRNSKIFDVDNLVKVYQNIMNQVGSDAYERFTKKYKDIPSYRESTFNSEYWEITKQIQDWNENPTTWNKDTHYNIVDTVMCHVGLYNHIFCKCIKENNIDGQTPQAPINLNKYTNDPYCFGFFDSIHRIRKWFELRLEFIDTRFNYNQI